MSQTQFQFTRTKCFECIHIRHQQLKTIRVNNHVLGSSGLWPPLKNKLFGRTQIQFLSGTILYSKCVMMKQLVSRFSNGARTNHPTVQYSKDVILD